MPLETGDFVNDLVVTNPTGADPTSAGDDHLRLVKKALKNTIAGFPGPALVTGADGGVVNAYALTPANPIPSYGLDMVAYFTPVATNTSTTPTLAISGLAAIPITRQDGSPVVSGDLPAAVMQAVAYTGSTFRLLNTTKAYIDSLAFSGVLPGQGGNAGRYLQTDGTTASWAVVTLTSRSVRTSSVILAENDRGSYVDVTANSFTQTLTAAATLGSTWACFFGNSGTGDVEIEAPAAVTATSTTSIAITNATPTFTVATGLAITAGDLVIVRRTSAPYATRAVGTVTSYTTGTGALVLALAYNFGSGTFTDWTITTRPVAAGIDGQACFLIYPGETRLIACDGVGFATRVVNPFAKTFTASANFIKPPGYQAFKGLMWSGGAGGGKFTPGAAAPGGAGGGCFPFDIPASYLTTSTVMTVGAGGPGNGGSSNPAGSDTTIGSLLTVTGGGKTYNTFVYAGAIQVPDSGGAVPAYGPGGLHNFGFGVVNSAPGAAPNGTIYGGGDRVPGNGNAGSSIYGGGAGGGVNTVSVVVAFGTSVFGGSGGAGSTTANGGAGSIPGGGGGSTTSAIAPAGGAGGRGEIRIWGAC